MEKLNEIKQNEKLFYKNLVFFLKKLSPHTAFKVQKEKFGSL